jgi:hypothetical protein
VREDLAESRSKDSNLSQFGYTRNLSNNINNNNTEDSETEPLDREAEATAAASASNNPSGFSVVDSLTYSISRKTSIDSYDLYTNNRDRL